MGIKSGNTLLHWNYFLALESDLANLTRYVEFSEANFSTYSIEFAQLLLSASSEVDVLLKSMCAKINSKTKVKNINHCQLLITKAIPEFITEPIFIQRFKLRLHPWIDWKSNAPPLWWQAYNKVKHERNTHFVDANLKNALNSMAALLLCVHRFYKLDLKSQDSNWPDNMQVSMILQPPSQLLTFSNSYYYSGSQFAFNT